MANKTLKELTPEQDVFIINGSFTLYSIQSRRASKVFCVIIGGLKSSVNKLITFPEDKVVTILKTCILKRLEIEQKFFAENPKKPGSYILLKLISKHKTKKWHCEKISFKSGKGGKKIKLSIFTPVIKVD